MKKLNKNILFGLGALGAVAAPVAAVVACGDSKPSNNPVTTVLGGSNNHHNNVASTNAWDATTSTLDLSKITSQYELAKTLVKITQMDANQGIANGWLPLGDEIDKQALNRKYQDVKAIFEKLPKQDLTIHVKNGTSTPIDITLAFSKFVPAVIDSINQHPDSAAQGFESAASKAFAEWSAKILADTSAAAGDKTIANAKFPAQDAVGQGEILAGASLSPISMGSTTSSNDKPSHSVSSFMMVNMTGAGSLMKLTHLPDSTFEGFKSMLAQVDAFFKPLTDSTMLTDWATTNKVDWAKLENGTPVTSMPMLTMVYHLTDQKELLNGLFLNSALF